MKMTKRMKTRKKRTRKMRMRKRMKRKMSILRRKKKMRMMEMNRDLMKKGKARAVVRTTMMKMMKSQMRTYTSNKKETTRSKQNQSRLMQKSFKR